MQDIYDIIQELRSTSSIKEKQAILTENKDNKDLQTYLQLVYSPEYNYYQTQVVPIRVGFADGNIGSLKIILENLSKRGVTGHAARDLLSEYHGQFNKETQELIELAIERDIRAGVAEGTINKVWKGLIPTTPYQRCSLPKDVKIDQYPWEDGVFVQLKADGAFAYVSCQDNNVAIISRNGTRYPVAQFQNIIDGIDLERADGFTLMGELLVEEDGKILPRQLGNGILNSIAQGGEFEANQKPIYQTWDVIPNASFVPKGKCETSYEERFAYLNQIIQYWDDVTIIDTKRVYSYQEAIAFGVEKIKEGFEGAIVKHPCGIWKDGTSKEQFKVKLEVDVDLIIVGFNVGDPTSKYANTLGTVTCESSDGLLKVNVSGWTDQQRDVIWNSQEEYLGKIVAVTSNDLLAPSESNEYWSVFLPRRKEIRTDKTTADSLKRIQSIFDMAKMVEGAMEVID